MKRFNHCLILEDGAYLEVPYSTLFLNGERNPEFQGRYFIPFEDCLMEVSQADHKEHYRLKNRADYLKKEAFVHMHRYDAPISNREIGVTDGKYQSIMDSIIDTDTLPIDEVVSSRLMAEKLYTAMEMLSKEEKIIVQNIYFNNITERELAKIMNVSQFTVHSRKVKVLEKLKKFIKT